MRSASNYKDARANAQDLANQMGMDVGLKWNNDAKYYNWFLLPQKKNRTGHELACEVVHPEDLDKCKPGHGPCA